MRRRTTAVVTLVLVAVAGLGCTSGAEPARTADGSTGGLTEPTVPTVPTVPAGPAGQPPPASDSPPPPEEGPPAREEEPPPPTDESGEWVDSDAASPDVLPPDAWDRAYDGDGIPDDARNVAAMFVLMLQSWSWEQPEADRIDGLAPYISDEVDGQLRATEARWDDLDATRTFAEESAVASLTEIHPVEVTDGQVRFDVWTSTVRTDRFGQSEQDAMVRVWVEQDPQGVWQIVAVNRD